MLNYITFDIETYSPSDSDNFDINEFRCSVAGAYVSWLDEYIAFLEDDIKDFLELLKETDLVIGYNHVGFDLPVLQKYSSWDLLQLPSYDILVEIEKKLGFRLKLDDVCKANFQDDIKTDSYEQYRHYHKQGKWLELIDYCMNDVRLTQKIFKKILSKKPLLYRDLHQTKEVFLDEPKAGQVNLQDQAEFIF